MDLLQQAFSPKAKIRFIVVDVTSAGKALEARHLSGPVCGLALAEGLAATALLSADLSQDDEAISLRMRVSGPIEGMLLEATRHGNLRGYTNCKVIDKLDTTTPISTTPAMGESGSAVIIKSRPGQLLNQASLSVVPPSARTAAALFLNHSMQVPAGVEIAAQADDAGIVYARGIVAERMPDGSSQDFVRVLEAFEDCTIKSILRDGCDLEALQKAFDLELELREERPLQFACRCSQKKTEKVITTLALEDLLQMVSQGESTLVTCHMCGKDYSVASETIRQIIDSRT